MFRAESLFMLFASPAVGTQPVLVGGGLLPTNPFSFPLSRRTPALPAIWSVYTSQSDYWRSRK